LTRGNDDGIVVVEEDWEGSHGNKVIAGVLLRERLGHDATHGLEEYVERNGEVWRADVIQTCTDRLESRFHHVDEGFAKIVNQLAEMKVELLRWSFAFWVGQVVVTLAMVTLFARLLQP
jgi:hypothetical protein